MVEKSENLHKNDTDPENNEKPKEGREK